MRNRRIIDERYKDGVIHIAPEFIMKASENNLLELIAREKPEAVLGGDSNIYIGIKKTNHVLLHVKENHYTVINRRVWCNKTGRWIFVAKRLANGFRFTIADGEVTTQPRRKHNCKRKTLSIYRIITSYARYGVVDGLDSRKNVHHVSKRFYNIISCLRYVDEDVHRKYHSNTGNNRRGEGKVINSYKEFCDFLDTIKRVDKMASIMPM